MQLTTPGPPSLKMSKRGPPRFTMKILFQPTEMPPGLGCPVTGVGKRKEDLGSPA